MFGGIWNKQNRQYPGTYIRFISKKNKTTTNIPLISTKSLFLVDKNKVYFKTLDGFNLSVEKA